jgi:Ni,Fe-hydrogenase I cytochrome b subunit
MTKNARIRQFHRWTALVFTVTTIITAVVLAQENPVEWVSYVPLFPLAVLLITGLTLYTQHYLGKRRAAHQR